MVIKVLGSGCKNCKVLEANTIEAVKQMGIVKKKKKVEKIEEIMSYGVMSTPALVVDETVKSMGRVLSPEDIKKFLV